MNTVTEKLLATIFVESFVSHAGAAMGVASIVALAVPVMTWLFPSIKTNIV
jgi:branched-subunit amino acid permease